MATQLAKGVRVDHKENGEGIIYEYCGDNNYIQVEFYRDFFKGLNPVVVLKSSLTPITKKKA